MNRWGTVVGWLVAGCGVAVAVAGVVTALDSSDDGSPEPVAAESAPATVAPATVATTPPTAPAPSTTATTTPAPTTASVATVAPTTAAPATTIPPTTTLAPAEAVDQFLQALSAALRTGDTEFLVGHLHDLVFDRYDADACTDQLRNAIPDASIEFVGITEVGAWEWTTDAITRSIDGITTVSTRTTSDGTNFSDTESHVFVDADGVVRWFTDCGAPRGDAL